MWKQSIEKGFYEIIKGFSVFILFNQNMLNFISQILNLYDYRYLFVNLIDGVVIGGYIVSGEKLFFDIIVNYYEMFVFDRNKLFQRR